jgi:hypothetical protein
VLAAALFVAVAARDALSAAIEALSDLLLVDVVFCLCAGGE